MSERDLQMQEQSILKKQKEDEDKLWAWQQEELRKKQVLADREQKRQLRSMAESVKDTQTQQKSEH